MKCKICRKEFPDTSRRAFHAHCIRMHPEEYKGKTIEEMTDDPVPPRAHEVRDRAGRYPKKKKTTTRPAGFRLLNPTDEQEAFAIEHGFSYIDDQEECYTSKEAEKNGWV